MPGRVYVYNCFNETINNFAVAGYSGGNISGCSASNYQPQGNALPRIKSADQRTSAQFALGSNPCMIAWDSYTMTTNVNIPDQSSGVSLNDDLILYVTVNQSILLNTRGNVLNTFPNNNRS